MPTPTPDPDPIEETKRIIAEATDPFRKPPIPEWADEDDGKDSASEDVLSTVALILSIVALCTSICIAIIGSR